MKLLMPYSEAGKAFKLIEKITLDLIKSRKEGGQTDKVCCVVNVQSYFLSNVHYVCMIFAV